jgi:hypothetical protein
LVASEWLLKKERPQAAPNTEQLDKYIWLHTFKVENTAIAVQVINLDHQDTKVSLHFAVIHSTGLIHNYTLNYQLQPEDF